MHKDDASIQTTSAASTVSHASQAHTGKVDRPRRALVVYVRDRLQVQRAAGAGATAIAGVQHQIDQARRQAAADDLQQRHVGQQSLCTTPR